MGGTSAVPYKLSDWIVGMVEGNEAVEYLVDGVGVMLLERSRNKEMSVRKSSEWSVKRHSSSSIV